MRLAAAAAAALALTVAACGDNGGTASSGARTTDRAACSKHLDIAVDWNNNHIGTADLPALYSEVADLAETRTMRSAANGVVEGARIGNDELMAAGVDLMTAHCGL